MILLNLLVYYLNYQRSTKYKFIKILLSIFFQPCAISDLYGLHELWIDSNDILDIPSVSVTNNYKYLKHFLKMFLLNT